MDHVEIGGTIRLKSIYDPRGMDHVEIGGTSQSVICNLSHFCAKYTRSYIRDYIVVILGRLDGQVCVIDLVVL